MGKSIKTNAYLCPSFRNLALPSGHWVAWCLFPGPPWAAPATHTPRWARPPAHGPVRPWSHEARPRTPTRATSSMRDDHMSHTRTGLDR